MRPRLRQPVDSLPILLDFRHQASVRELGLQNCTSSRQPQMAAEACMAGAAVHVV